MIANLAAPAARAILTRAPAFPAVVRPAHTALVLPDIIIILPEPAQAATAAIPHPARHAALRALTAPALHHALTRQPAPAEAAGVREAVRSARHPAAPAPA